MAISLQLFDYGYAHASGGFIHNMAFIALWIDLASDS